MPILTPEQKLRIIQGSGFNPEEYDYDSETRTIFPKMAPEPQPGEGHSSTTTLQKANVPSAPSPLESAGRAGAESTLPFLAGAGGWAAGAALAPETGALSLLVPLGASIVASLGGSALQKAAIPQDVQQRLFTRPEDIQQNPVSTALGGFIPGAMTARPSIRDIKALGSGVGNLLEVGRSALTPLEKSVLLNAGMNVAPAAGMEAYDVLSGKKEFDPGMAALNILPGALLTKPTALGKLLGFHDVPVSTETSTTPKAPVAPKEPAGLSIEDVIRAGGIPQESELLGRGITGKKVRGTEGGLKAYEKKTHGMEGLKARDESSLMEEAQARMEGEGGPEPKEIPYSNPRQQEHELALREKARQDLEEQRRAKAELDRQEAAQLASENAERALALQNKVKEKQLATPEKTVEPRVTTELGKEIHPDYTGNVEEDIRQNLEKPTTEAERIQEDFDLGRREQENADLLESVKTDVSKLSPSERKKLDEHLRAQAKARGFTVQDVPEVLGAKGTPIAGDIDLKNRIIRISGEKAGLETVPHEGQHGFINDLLRSKKQKDIDLALKGIEYSYGKKFKTPEDWFEFQRTNPEEALKVEENWVKHGLDLETVKQTQKSLYGTKRERFKQWAENVKAHFSNKLGMASYEDVTKHTTARYRKDVPREAVRENPVIEKRESEGTPTDYEQYQDVQRRMSELIKAGDYSSPEFQKLWKENETIKNRNGGMPPKAPEIRESIEASIPKESPEYNAKENKTPSFFSSATKKIRNLGTPTAEHIYQKAEEHASERSLLLGKYRNTVQAEISSYPKAVKERVDQYGRENMSTNGNPSFELDPNSPEKSLYDSLREYLVKIADENTGLREINKNPYYWPQILNTRVSHVWTKNPNSPESRRYKNEWMEHAKQNSEYSEKELQSILSEYINAIGGENPSLQFGALRKAAGIGLPESLQDNNLLSRFSRYGSRVAKDRAYQILENDPVTRYTLRLKDAEGNITTEAPTLPNGEEIDRDLGGTQPIQDIKKWMFGDFEQQDFPRLGAAMKAVSSGLLGTATGARNLVQAPNNLLAVIGPRNAKSLVDGLKNWQQSWKDSFATNARQLRMNELEFGSAASPDMWTRTFSEVADFMRKWSGRELSEQAERAYSFGVGKAAALAEFGRAVKGDTKAIEWLKEHGKGVKDIGSLIGKGANDIPEEALNRIAKSVVEHASGSYDERGLPTYTMEGPLAPFLALSRWNIEKANRIYSDVLAPAKRGDFAPLLTYTLGSVLTGAAIQQLNTAMSGGKRPSEATVEEAFTAENTQHEIRSIIGLAQMGSFAGIVSDIMKAGADVTSGHAPRGLSFPLADFFSETLTHNMADYFAAINAGEDRYEATKALIETVMRDSVQTARLASYLALNKDEVERKNAYRDVRIWQELSKKATPESKISQPNEFLDIVGKKFKRAKTPEEIGETLPEALNDIARKSEDPMELKRKLEGLRRNSYQTVPAEPIEMMDYLDFLSKTQGKEAAADRLFDYLRQRELNKVKSQLVPRL